VRCGGEWREWADLFTEDARYLEHTYGEFNGREEIYAWISSTMAEWPNRAMTSFPTTGACATRSGVGGSARSRTASETRATGRPPGAQSDRVALRR